MKINDIISESIDSQNEAAPMGILAKAGHKVASALGSKTSAAKLDVGTRANEIFNSFKDYALRTGVDLSAVDAKILKNWIKSQGLPVPSLDPAVTVYDLNNKQNIQKVFTGASQQSFAKAAPAAGSQLGGKYGIAQTTPASAATAAAPRLSFKQISNAVAGLTPQQKAALKASL